MIESSGNDPVSNLNNATNGVKISKLVFFNIDFCSIIIYLKIKILFKFYF